MKKSILIVPFVLMASVAVAQPAYEKVGEAGGWNVFKANTTGGCFIERAGDDYVVQMGTQATIIGEGDGEDFGYFAVFVQDTVDLADGDTADVEFRLGEDTFTGTMVGAKRNDGYEGAYVKANNPNFGNDLANEQTLYIDLDGDTAATIDLTGSKVAMEAGMACGAN